MTEFPSINRASQVYRTAILDILPLSISVIPWGVLCGSMAIQTGFSPLQAQSMSLFVFAGAAQLSGMAIVAASGSVFSLMSSTAVISSRHLLYSATFREDVKEYPFILRILIAFLLTDEMFAVTETYRRKTGDFSAKYALISGFTFYVLWNISTFAGIYIGQQIIGLETLGLEFAIAATFIAMVIPEIKTKPLFISVLVSGFISLILHYLNVNNGLLIASLMGMSAGYFTQIREENNE